MFYRHLNKITHMKKYSLNPYYNGMYYRHFVFQAVTKSRI